MRFKITKLKTANASNSTAIDKFANAEIGDFGLMGDIYALISASQGYKQLNTAHKQRKQSLQEYNTLHAWR